MSYNELKSEYDKTRHNIIRTMRELATLQEERKRFSADKDSLDKNFQTTYQEAKKKSAIEYKNKLLAPVEKRLITAENHLLQLESEYTTEKAELTVENISKECSTEQDILNDIKRSSLLLKEQLQHVVGAHFFEALNEHLAETKVEIATQDLAKVIECFNEYESVISEMSSQPDQINKLFSTIEEKVLGLTTESIEKNKYALPLVTGFVVLLVFLAAKYLFPVYIVILLFLCGFNILRAHKIYKIILIHKAVHDNIKPIDNLLRQKIEEELLHRKEKIDNFYQPSISSAEQIIKQLKSEVLQVSLTADNSFEFKDDIVRQDYEDSILRNVSKDSAILQQESVLKGQLEALKKNEKKLKEQLDSLVGDVMEKYLNFNTIGTEVILDPNFLFDIDTEKSRPVFFKHPQLSCLFLYNDDTDVSDFIRLLNVQLRCKLSPFCFSINVLDETLLGQSYLSFVPPVSEKSGSVENLFKIHSDSAKFKEKLLELETEMMKRMTVIRTEFDQIEGYNKAMLSMDSVTASYEFVFILDPSTDVLSDVSLRKMTMNGGRLGIFFHYFIRHDVFKEMKEESRKLLESVSKIYLLQNGNFNSRSKDYIQENFCAE